MSSWSRAASTISSRVDQERKRPLNNLLITITNLERQPVSTLSIPGRPHTRHGSITNMPTVDEAEREISDVSRRYRHST